MNKLLQTTLITAIMATSSFASTIAELQNGGEVQAGAVIEFKDQELTLSKDKSLNVYGSLTGTGNINCSGTGKVNVYGSVYKQNEANAEAIKTAANIGSITAVHTIDETNKGSIAETVKVTPPEALNKTEADLAAYASGLSATDLVYVANSGGTETKCVGGAGEATTIPAALANAATDSMIEGLTPTFLLLENKVKFTGNNSGFNQNTVQIGSIETSADVEYAGEDSAFLTETIVEEGSKLTISSSEGVTLTKDLTVNGSSKYQLNENQDEIIKDIKNGSLIVTGKLTLGPGMTLTLGEEMFSPIAENPSDYPKVMTWPVGSFSNPLTQVNKNYYEISSFNDGTSLKFYYDEDRESWEPYRDETNPESMMSMIMIHPTEGGGLEITSYGFRKEISITDLDSLPHEERDGKTYYTFSIYDQSVEFYEDPENPGQYRTDSEGHWYIHTYENNINIECMRGDSPIKTLTADEVSALTPYKTELIYAKDDIFSYTYDSTNDSWVRYRQTQFISPEQFVNAFEASPEKTAGETDINNVLFYAMTTDQTRMIALHKDSSKGATRQFKRDNESLNWSSIASGEYFYPSVRGYIEGNYGTGWYYGTLIMSGTPTADPDFYNDFLAGKFSLYTYEQVKDQLPSFS